MGCATSKEKVCQNCHTPYSPVRRSYSMYIPKKKDINDSENHLVNLTSSTLGSLKLDSMNLSQSLRNDQFALEIDEYNPEKDELLIEARTWSQMINEKIPKVVVPVTPVRTPPGEPETINAWELMEGLEDITPLKPPAHHHEYSFSFPVSPNTISSRDDQPKYENSEESPKMADNESSLHSNGTSIVSDFDPEVISTFRKALEELPPANPFYLKPLVIENTQGPDDEAESVSSSKRENVEVQTEYKLECHEKNKLVIYFTSLRGVRKTYQACCDVRVILKGLGVKVDERDVSMHSGFKEELKELLGKKYAGGGLPRVFLGEKYIGGADEIRRMNEDGHLEKLVENCERTEDGGGGGSFVANRVCEACGDIRFAPCETCSGSCKIYYEAEYGELELEQDEYGFKRCPDCNENGLIRCPICCD